jgi:hypothetical protein
MGELTIVSKFALAFLEMLAEFCFEFVALILVYFLAFLDCLRFERAIEYGSRFDFVVVCEEPIVQLLSLVH